MLENQSGGLKIHEPQISTEMTEATIHVAPADETPVSKFQVTDIAETYIAETLEPGLKPTKEKNCKLQFKDLSLSDAVQQAVEMAGYETPTAIQAEIIPLILAGRDVLAQSQTGTGKTAAFALPILTRADVDRRKPQVLVLTPTRELAIQVANSFSTYATCIPGFSVAAIYGGQDYDPQLRQLRRGVQVVVGTPGRIIDHIKRGTLDLSQIECLVLDEADEMLNMGFLEDVEFILKHAPAKRQIALFSATLPAPIRKIAETYQHNPAKVTIKKKTMTADSIRHRAVFMAHRDKVNVLLRFLEVEETDGVIVFTRTKDATSVVAEQLTRAGLSAIALNGDMPQRSRERTIERLKAGSLDILVATDVAARGLDVTRVSHVFNYDFPEGSESYVHRVGRTGRAGRKGEAIIFLTRTQRGKLRSIEKATKQSIEIVDQPGARQINKIRVSRFKEQIAETIAKQDLSEFHQMIGQYAEQSEQPVELIAAAIAHMGQQGRSFFTNDRPAPKSREFDSRSEHGGRGGKRNRHSGAPRAGMTSYRLAVGRQDGIGPGNIVGAVANEGGIDNEQIGAIRMHDSYSTIELPENLPSDVFETLRNAWVGGKQLKISPAREESGQHSSPRRKGPANFKSRGGNSESAAPRGNKYSAKGKKPGFAGKRKKRKVKS